jgi:hypothetical protein
MAPFLVFEGVEVREGVSTSMRERLTSGVLCYDQPLDPSVSVLPLPFQPASAALPLSLPAFPVGRGRRGALGAVAGPA